jgi:hypothetical protein
MHETIKYYATVRFALSEKLALKTPNDKCRFSLILRLKKSGSVLVCEILRYFLRLNMGKNFGTLIDTGIN